MSEIDTSKTQENRRYPKKIIASFQLGNLIGLMMSQLYAQQLAFYYLGVVGLSVGLFLLANIIYTIFNMVNDPLLGYLCDKSQRFTSRFGKRFPFIIIGGIPWCFMSIFLFMAPSVIQSGQLAVFFWLVFFLCLSDCFFSLYDINRVALFPDKFRDNEDRKIGGTITAVLETLGVMLGILIPVLIIDSYGSAGWALQAIIISFIAFGLFVLMIPGVKEDPAQRKKRAESDAKMEHESFFKGMKETLKNKNFLGYMALYIAYSSAMGVVMASIPFYVQDILQMPKIGELIVLGYVAAVIISAPIWYKLSPKLGIKKVAFIGALLLALMGIPFLFAPMGPSALFLVIIILIMAGFVDGAIISMTMPLFSSVVDEATLTSGKRKEGMYNGTHLFFARLGIFYQALAIFIVATWTGYHAGSTKPSELMGLRIQISVFPLIIMLIGALLFWKLYNISQEQMESNSKKLLELNL